MASKYQATGTSLVVQWLSPSNAGDTDCRAGCRAKIPHASRPKTQNTKQKHYCNKFIRDFKNDPPQTNLLKKGIKQRVPYHTKKKYIYMCVRHGLFKFSLSFIKYMLNIYN